VRQVRGYLLASVGGDHMKIETKDSVPEKKGMKKDLIAFNDAVK